MPSIIHDSQPKSANRNASLKVIASLLAQHQPRISAKRLTVDIDVEDLSSSLVTPPSLLRQIEFMLNNAIEDCVESGEISITVLDTLHGIEIEVSDSASTPANDNDCETRLERATFSGRRIPIARPIRDANSAASRFVSHVSCVRCPQGGLAWSIVTNNVLAALRAA